MSTDIGLISVAHSMQESVVQHRRHLHQHPELRWQEGPTLGYLRTAVRDAADGITPFVAVRDLDGGLVVDLVVNADSDRILLRADVDALPITEATGLPFASQTPGVMHACGHDAHSAMLLGAFEAIVSGQVTPRHNLRFVWQRAEENPGTEPRPISGGERLVQEGVLEGVSAAYGLHLWCDPQRGTPGVFLGRPGPLLGNSGRMKFVIRCPGGHVARPHVGVNAARVAGMVQQVLDTYLARHFDPLQPATLEPVIVRTGSASNVLAQEAELWYGVRTLLPRAEHEQVMEGIEREVRIILQLFPGAELTEVQKIGGHPALINHPGQYALVSDRLTAAGQEVEDHPPVLGGEDFAHYLDAERGVPGCMLFLGAHTPGSGGHHADTFNPDESVFWQGVLYWLLLACG